MTSREWVTVVLAGFGTLLVLLATIGLVRMPDLYSRMQATTKATTLGMGLIAAGVGVYFSNAEITAKVVLVIVFLFLTQPIAAHMIARAGHLSGIKPFEGCVRDDYAVRDETNEPVEVE